MKPPSGLPGNCSRTHRSSRLVTENEHNSIMTSPNIIKRSASAMTELERDCAFEILASNFSNTLATAKREAAEDEYFGRVDECDCLDEAALIDPELLPPSKRDKFVSAFGADCPKFSIDTEHIVADKTTDYPRGGGPGVRGVAIFHTNPKTLKRARTFYDSKTFFTPTRGNDEDDDEYVTIRIKTGKGGRGMYRVPKSVAGDLMGCD